MIYHGILLTDTAYDFRIRPLGAYSIANVLREQGYNILVIDMFSKLPYQILVDTLSKIVTKDTLFVGYSTTFFSYPSNAPVPLEGGIQQFADLNKHLKDQNANLKIIVGGSNANAIANIVNQQECYVDYIVYGFADASAVKLVNSLAINEEPIYDSTINDTRCITYDVKGTEFDFRNSTHVWSKEDAIQKGECLPIEVGRGCVFRCSFCTFPLVGKHKNDMSYIRLEDTIADEIKKNFDQHQTTTYFIVDDTFNERTDKIEMMLRIRDKAKIDLNFTGYCRLDLIARKPEQLPLLHDLKFDGFGFGIETLHEPAQKAIGKHARPEELFDTMYKIRDLYNNKVSMQTAYIAGLPGENREILEYWVSKLLADDSPIDNLNIIPLWMSESAEGKSKFFSDPEKYGYRIKNHVLWENDIWSFKECSDLAYEINMHYINNGRNRVGCFQAAGLTHLGFDYYDLIKMPMKEYFETVQPQLPELNKNYQGKYFSDLFSFLNEK